MEGNELLKNRRSVRSFKNEAVREEVMQKILQVAKFAPSWANGQIVRYTIITNAELKNKIVEEGYLEFKGNSITLDKAAGLVVVSYVRNISGCNGKGKPITDKSVDEWSMFDAGIAAQQFCLAAYNEGIGTVMQGIFNQKIVSKIIDLPKDETIAIVIPYGYFEVQQKATPRMEINEIARFK